MEDWKVKEYLEQLDNIAGYLRSVRWEVKDAETEELKVSCSGAAAAISGAAAIAGRALTSIIEEINVAESDCLKGEQE